ncbi:MAG: hypothetical protein ACREKH_06635 [Candidatus Rokuibacteriota bacterium]
MHGRLDERLHGRVAVYREVKESAVRVMWNAGGEDAPASAGLLTS